ncbi:hypothetical protein V2S66_31250 [Streptomyces sp. V4-01]|uniref:DUF222 domain-containing protein n=1 Tax=Actinacidiphila polyblastidii TaxID=3110430 RepID=A0ABU7PKR9_9ACTN|nr:hypothetical protein [Streptomyces sp. V4-01]
MRPRDQPNATTQGETMNLTELITTAAANQTPVPLGLAAALYAAVAADRGNLALGLAPKTGDMTVDLNHGDGWTDATVIGSLRYSLDHADETVTRLCTNPACDNECIGNTLLTSVCDNHIDTLVPGLLPNTGDDILPGDREAAAAHSRRMRLDAWEREATEAGRVPAGDLRVIAKLRQEAA